MNNTIQNTNNQNLLSNPNIMSSQRSQRGRPRKEITQLMKWLKRSSEILKDLREIKKQLRNSIWPFQKKN